MKYRVVWEVLETGHIEKGKRSYGSPREAEEIARMLNETWPEFRHWAESVEAGAENQVAGTSQEDAA